MYYTYTDYLGSLIALTNESGTVVERYAYDPWGARRNPTNWTQTDNRTTWIVNRGYTMHEHLDAFSIINMNGRVYDPLTAQFFSPDPFIQAPDNWLNFNRYAYAFGNPFKYTDPDGEVAWFVPVLIGAGVYIAIEYVTQVVDNYMEASTNPTVRYTSADIWFNKIDWFDIAIKGVEGGLSVVFPTLVPWFKYGTPFITNAVDLNFDGTYKVVGKNMEVGDYFAKTGLEIATIAINDLVKWGYDKKHPSPDSYKKLKQFQEKSLFERYKDIPVKDIFSSTLKELPWDFSSSFIGNVAKQGWENQYEEYHRHYNQNKLLLHNNPEFPYYPYQKNKQNKNYIFEKDQGNMDQLIMCLSLNLRK